MSETTRRRTAYRLVLLLLLVAVCAFSFADQDWWLLAWQFAAGLATFRAYAAEDERDDLKRTAQAVLDDPIIRAMRRRL